MSEGDEEDGLSDENVSRYHQTGSPAGQAGFTSSEYSQILRDRGGGRRHIPKKLERMYNGLLNDQREVAVHKKVEALVDQFEATTSTEVRNSVKAAAENLAAKLLRSESISPDRAVMASVAREFLDRGKSFREVVGAIAKLYPKAAEQGDLLVEVALEKGEEPRVLVNGKERKFKAYSKGVTKVLRVPLYDFDDHAVIEVGGAAIVGGYDRRRVELIDEKTTRKTLRVKADRRSYELYRLLKETHLDSELVGSGPIVARVENPDYLLRRFSLTKLTLTTQVALEAGLLRKLTAEYYSMAKEMFRNSDGRSYRKLAEEALLEADSIVWSSLPSLDKTRVASGLPAFGKGDEKYTGVSGLVVRSELKVWDV